MEIRRHVRQEGGVDLPFVVWLFDGPRRVLSSSVLGGGLGDRFWALNATVARGYDRDDPADHLRSLAADVHLEGPGVAMMTAVDVAELVHRADSGVDVWATVGIETASWAADESPSWHRTTAPGTINVVVDVPVRLSDAALVNAVATVTEAKVQAIVQRGLAGTGTPTDAVCVCCAVDGPEEAYAGPRSVWGARIARAVHDAVATGLAQGGDRT